MKKLAIIAAAALYALAAVSAWGAEVVLHEEFKDEGCKNRWDLTPENDWKLLKEGTCNYAHFSGSEGGEAASKNKIQVTQGEKYKVEYRYRGATTFWWNNTRPLYSPYTNRWLATGFIKSVTETGLVGVKIAVGNLRETGTDIDYVIVRRCETAVYPTSMGSVKALFK